MIHWRILWMLGAVVAFYLLVRARVWISARIRARRVPADPAKLRP